MLRDIKYPKSHRYKSSSEYDPMVFFLDHFVNSTHLKFHLGFFSTKVFRTITEGFALFISNGGKIDLIINHFLTKEDKEFLSKNENIRFKSDLKETDIIRELLNNLDDVGKHFEKCLSYLIQNNRLNINIIKPKDGVGYEHTKEGIFFDQSDAVYFDGSANFTAAALLNNNENITADPSWMNEVNRARIEEFKREFDKIWSGIHSNYIYLKPSEAEEISSHISKKYPNTSIEDILKESNEISKLNFKQSKKLIKRRKELEFKVLTKINHPRFPYEEGPREYQLEAYDNWASRDYTGIFSMATGTGKTLTALNCLLQLFNKNNSYKAVIIVPTIVLVEQWKQECYKFNFQNIITVNSKQKWDGKISFLNTASKFTHVSFIIIVTYSSFYRKKFQIHFNSLPKDTLIIADEVHNLGSNKVSKILPQIKLNTRIGLSATPSRKYDNIGNTSIENFFKDESPYTYSYEMRKALENGWLCRYKYFPHVVELQEIEMERYVDYSKKLLRYFNNKTKSYESCPEVERLLLARKRIIHKASNKLKVFQDILTSEFHERGNLKFTLVYVPEGFEPDYENNDVLIESEEEMRLINEYTRVVSGTDSSIMVKQYTSKISDRELLLNDFETGNLHVLTSMKCLDEGVDVPRSELAIFCSSTGNPRQFIQRRGRVLRLHKDKTYATIHDLVVIPNIDRSQDYYEMERNLVKKELERVVDFSFLSMNKIDSFLSLQDILERYNLNLFDINDEINQ